MLARRRALLVCSILAMLVALPLRAESQYAPSGLTGAQLKQLHQLGMPIVAPVPAPRGFKVTRVVLNGYDHTYKIYYANKLGGTIAFQADQLYRPPQTASTTANAPSTPAPEPKRRSFLQKLFTAPVASPSPATGNALHAGSTSNETEGQATSALVADSQLVGPIKFAPAGPCLEGVADGTKGTIRGLRVTVSACNFDNADVLISAYKNLQRV
jgi:hypothetical protein